MIEPVFQFLLIIAELFKETLFKHSDWHAFVCKICYETLDRCDHYHGEWQCLDCGEWTFPVYYEFDDGCQFCGSENVKRENFEIGQKMTKEN
jgi:hypothetical protein